MPEEMSLLKPSGKSFAEIEEFAAGIAAQYGFDPSQSSVHDFAEKLGGQVVRAEDKLMTELMESGSLEVRGPGDFTIELSPFTGELRNNFTIAHELGHYFLHSGYPDQIREMRAPRYGTDRVEQEANRFAAGLLTPRAEFKRAAEELGCNPVKLAGRFRISPRAAAVRMESLGLIPKS